MNLRPLVLGTLAMLGAVLPGCRCGDNVQTVQPDLSVTPAQLSFGKVKAGGQSVLPVKLASQSRAPVTIQKVSLRDGSAPGKADAFTVLEVPESLGSLSEGSFKIQFNPAPDLVQAYEAILVVESNDAEEPAIEILVDGEGAEPVLSVVPDCSTTRKCRGTASLDPPSIDYGEEPFQRAVELPSTQLPTVTMINEGEVELVVTKLAIEGADASAFQFVGSATLPHQLPDGTPALILGAGEGQGVPIRFKPSSQTQTDYAAEVVIQSDDPMNPEVRVALSGKLGENLPPDVCANIVRVAHHLDVTESYDTRQHWDALLVPPAAGYDFSGSREIRPKSTVHLSALSDAADASVCTTDPEDQRQNLQFRWSFTGWPMGGEAPAIVGANTATPSFTLPLLPPGVMQAEYAMELTVTDGGGAFTTVPIRFASIRREDLIVQLAWNGENGAFAGVDLDLHLVRPSAVQTTDAFSGAFDWFGGAAKTSGDLNGYAYKTVFLPGQSEGLNYDWGQNGEADDPRLNLDDQGNSGQYEDISLNYPENDPRCATEACTYKLFIHYFGDGRFHSAPPSCNVTAGACLDGEACDCPSGLRCVASVAAGSSATGTGTCYRPPEASLRVFFKGNPVPAAVIPLETLVPPDTLFAPAPCHMIYAADVVWPAKNGTGALEPSVTVKGTDGTGRITAPVISRFGTRSANDVTSCHANDDPDGDLIYDWYAQEDR